MNTEKTKTARTASGVKSTAKKTTATPQKTPVKTSSTKTSSTKASTTKVSSPPKISGARASLKKAAPAKTLHQASQNQTNAANSAHSANTAQEMFDPLRLLENYGQLWQNLTKQYLPKNLVPQDGLPNTEELVQQFELSLPDNIQAPVHDWLKQLQKQMLPPAFSTTAKFDYDKAKDLPDRFANEMKVLWDDFFLHQKTPQLSDRRFSNAAWQDSPQHAFLAAQYLLNTRYFTELTGLFESGIEGDKVRFNTEQWLEMMAPSNYLVSNPEAIQAVIDSKGESLSAGIKNLLSDLSKGHISLSDESQFKLGENLATTEGSVIFENELIQLIQYAPKTPQVHQRPLLMVPPCINKFYILDLQAHNSLVRYLVENGITVFLVSWRNPDVSLAHLTWDDYIKDGVLRAIEVTQEISVSISGQKEINAFGFCVGGTLLTTALAVRAHQMKDHSVKALTLITTFLDFSDTGVLGIFINNEMVQKREHTIGGHNNQKPQLLLGKDLASTFSMLRPNDLIWSYVVNNYLKGQSPVPMDLLFWNSDSSNLPGPMYCQYIRHTYLQNDLKNKGAFKVLGGDIDFSTLQTENFVYASREDHIVPWTSAYQSQKLLKGPTEFVLGASGHIAGVINPANKNKRCHWVGSTALSHDDAQQWFNNATEVPGSWWSQWLDWLQARSDKKITAPKTLGNKRYKVIEAAPGRYVTAVNVDEV